MNIPFLNKVPSIVKVTFILGLLLLSDVAFSTHIVGGEITYRHLRDDIFEISLTVRRDCINGADDAQFDNPAVIAVYSGDGRLATWVGSFGFLEIPFNSDDTLNTVITSDCGFIGQDVCVQETRYIKEIRLPFRTAGYQLSYQRCCRNITLNNVVDPTNTGSTYSIFISGDALRGQNSTPQFNQWADIYLCANEQLAFDHSAIDEDGDSLVYKLITPYTGASEMFPKPDTAPTPPYNPVVYFPPYDMNDPMGGVPLEFDSETGLLTAIPNTVGQFLIGVSVEEYRDGNLLSTVRRDFEYNVRICTDAPSISFEAENPVCNDYTTTFNNTSVDVDQFVWYFDFPNDDPQFKSTEVSPTFTFPVAGTYLVMLEGTRAADGCKSTFTEEIIVLDNVIEVDFTAELTSCGDNIYSVALTDNSFDATDPENVAVAWNWTVSTDIGDFTGEGKEAVIEFEGIMGQIELMVTMENGCTNSKIEEFTIDDLLPDPGFNAYVTECLEDGTYTLTFSDNSENQADIVSFDWNIDVDGDVQTLSGPSVSINVIGTESVNVNYTITYNNGCISELDTVVDVSSVIPTASFSKEIACNSDGTIDLVLESTSNFRGMIVSLNWTIVVNGQTSNFEGDQVVLENLDPGTVILATLEAIYISDCISISEELFNINDLLPKAAFISEVTSCNNDGTFDVTFRNNSDNLDAVTSATWEITVGSNTQTFTESEVVLQGLSIQDIVDVALNVTYDNGCDASTREFIFVAEILPVAEIVSEVSSCNDDNTVDIILTNGYMATGGVNTISWTVDLGSIILTSEEESFLIENVSLDAVLSVTLDVSYNNGCVASASREIIVSDILPSASYVAEITECKDDGSFEVTLTDNSGNISSVEWSIDINGNVENFTGSPVIITVESDDQVEILQTVSFNNGCDSQVGSTLDILSLIPDASFTAEVIACNEDGTVDIELTGDSSAKDKALNYTWTINVEGTESNFTGNQVTITGVNTSSIIEVALTIDFVTSCSASTDQDINVAELLPKADFIPQVSSCNEDGTVDLTLINNSDNLINVSSANWEVTIDGLSQSLSGNIVTIPGLNVESQIVVDLNVTYTNNCDASTSRMIDLTEILPQAIINASVSECNDANSVTVVLANGYESPFGVASIMWTVNTGSEILTSTEEVFEISELDPESTINVSLAVIYNNGCAAEANEDILIADILPMARYEAVVTQCNDDGTFEVTITDTSGDIESVAWVIAVNGQEENYTGTPVVLTLGIDDVLTITQSVEFANGCSDTKESEISVSDLVPNAEINAQISSCNEDGTADLTLTYSSNADDVNSVQWEVTVDGETISSTDEQLTVPGLSLDAQVSVVLSLGFESSCTATDEQEYILSELLPKADFTPQISSCNSDGTVDLALINSSENIDDIISSSWTVVINGESQDLSGNTVTIPGIALDATVEVTLDVTYSSNCDATITKEINLSDILPQAIVQAMVTECSNDNTVNIILTNGYESPYGVAAIMWTVDTGSEILTSTEEEFEIEGLDIESTISVSLAVIYNNGCDAEANEEIVLADILPMAGYEAVVTQCNDDGTFEVTITDTSGDIESLAWVIAVNGQEENYTGTPVVLTLGIEDVLTITQSVEFANGCSDTKESEISVSDLVPNAEINAQISSCNEDGTADLTLTYSSNAQDVSSVMWAITVDGETINSTDDEVSIPQLSLDSEINVTLNLGFESSCSATADSSFILSDILPDADYTADLISCPDEENIVVELTESSEEESTSVSWTVESDGQTFTGNDKSIIIQVNKNSISIVNLDVVFESGCTATLSDTLDVESLLPVPEFNVSVIDCPTTDSVNVEISDVTSVDDNIISWDWILSFADQMITSNSPSFTLTVPKDSTVSVSLTLGLENGCVLLLENGSFIPQLPTVEFVGDPVTGCLGDTVQLVSNPDPSLQYTWEPEEGLIFDNPDDRSNPSVVITGDMTYNVTVSDGSCEGTGSVSVAIDPNTTISISGDSISCDGNFTLVASGGQGGGFYQWSLTEEFTEIIFEGDTLMSTLSGPDVTVWTRLMDSNCNAEPVSFTVNNGMPDLAYLNPYEICRGDTLNFSVTNLNPNQILSFIWEENSHIISGDSTNSPLIGIGIEEMDSFYLVFNVENQYGCTFSDSVFVQIIENPEISFMPELEECGEYTVCFSITSEFNGTPLWEFGDPQSGFNNASIDEMPCHTYPGPGDYTVTLTTLSNYCSSAMAEETITLTESFTVDSISDQIVCVGDTINLTASASVDGLDFVWCTPEGDTLATGMTFEYIADTNDVDVLLKGFDFFGCSDTAAFVIDVFNFDLQFDIPDIVCNGEETQITVTNTSGGDLQYMWGPDDAIVSGEETDSPVISITETTDLTLSVFEPNAGCILDTTITVTASSITATITADPGNEINEGEDVILDVNSDADIVDYEWSDPTVNGNPVTVAPTENTTYTVTVTDNNGCTAVASIDITVRQAVCDESDVFIPNAFTPNGDGNNDVFMVRSNFIEEMELIVYNRWGQEIFRSTVQDQGWDGTFNGDELGPDVYGYRLEVLCINDVVYITKGNVTLLR